MQAFCVKFQHQLRIESCSPTERGAMVNWLYTSGFWQVPNSATDKEIQERFENCRAITGAEVVAVEVTEVINAG